jgi:hypothetical protein
MRAAEICAFGFELPACMATFAVMVEHKGTESRGKQLMVGGAILAAVFGSAISLLLFWREIPGLFGETVGKFVGIMSTPFFMEASFVVLGFLIVVSLNIWRRHKDGDEFVTIEENDDGSPPVR